MKKIPDFRNFSPAFEEKSLNLSSIKNTGLPRAKTTKEIVWYYLAMIFIMPWVALLSSVAVAEGLRYMFPLFQRRLYTLPVPGFGQMRLYDGVSKLDTAFIFSILLFILLTFVWMKVISGMQGWGNFARKKYQSPFVYYFMITIVSVIIFGDAALFYLGIRAQTSSGWSNTPWIVGPVMTLVYTAGMAIIGWWHADYHHSSKYHS